MIINHVCYEENWFSPNEIIGAKTLILGSFNPFNPNGNNTDYYYGRGSNYFWKVIAGLIGEDVDYFLNNRQLKLEVMNRYKFCFLDIISSIEISNQEDNQQLILQFANDHIFTNFSDSILFTTNHHNAGVVLNRTYNQEVLNFINNHSIKKVMHTMGNNRITEIFTTDPLENGLGILGFQGYINSIIHLDTETISESYSPSAYAVRRGGENHILNLTNWLRQHLGINQL